MLVLGFVASADTYSLDARRRSRVDPDAPHERYGWPIKLLMCLGIFLMLLQAIAIFFKDQAAAQGKPLS